MVDGVRGPQPGAAPVGPAAGAAAVRATAPGAGFDAVLARSEGTAVTFSGHAARRIEQRGLQMDDAQLRRLQTAVDRAEAKGSRDSLILLDDLALVVSIKHRTVVTAVDEANQKEHVFTNIDSVVIAD